MNSESMIAQMRAIQMAARALDMTCEAFFASVAEAEKAHHANAAGDGACQHPRARRQPAGVMGHPNRFRCLECNEVIDPAGEAKA